MQIRTMRYFTHTRIAKIKKTVSTDKGMEKLVPWYDRATIQPDN